MDQTNQTSTPKYTKEYFIQKFEAIPEEEIGQGSLDNHCALWHCGARISDGLYNYTEEARALQNLIFDELGRGIMHVNDDPNGPAKQNVLKALKSI